MSVSHKWEKHTNLLKQQQLVICGIHLCMTELGLEYDYAWIWYKSESIQRTWFKGRNYLRSTKLPKTGQLSYNYMEPTKFQPHYWAGRNQPLNTYWAYQNDKEEIKRLLV